MKGKPQRRLLSQHRSARSTYSHPLSLSGVELVSRGVFHSSSLQCSTNGDDAWMRSRVPGGNFAHLAIHLPYFDYADAAYRCNSALHRARYGRKLCCPPSTAATSRTPHAPTSAGWPLPWPCRKTCALRECREHPRSARETIRRRWRTLLQLAGILDVAAGGELIRGSLQHQQRPGVAHAPSLERCAIGALAITVVVVSLPARPVRRIDLQHRIHHLQRIFDQRIAGLANS